MTLPLKPSLMAPEVYSKILDDATIDVQLKTDLIKVCEPCTKELGRHDTTSIENRFDDFSQNKSYTGNKTSVDDHDSFGHVKVFKDWVARLHTITGDRMTLIEKNMRILAGISPGATKQQIVLAREWATRRLLGNGKVSKSVSLTGTVCFIFLPDPGKTVSEMFTKEGDTLPCRLGLPSFLGKMAPTGFVQEYIGYIVEGTDVENVRTVTVFHPGYRSVRDLWKPGGETKPHPHGPKDHIALGGLAELVCDQVFASATTGEIFGFEVRY